MTHDVAPPPVSESRPRLSFSEPHEADGATVITATSSRVSTLTTGALRPAVRAAVSTGHPIGAFVLADGRVRWRPTVDATRLLATAEIVAGAVLVAHRLSRRPSATRARVTMGPGGWVSMRGGALGVRPGSRPWGRRRPVVPTDQAGRRPVWARLLAAVPLQRLVG